MDSKDLRKFLTGKSFILEGTNLIYTFIKESDTLDISGVGGKPNKVRWSIWESEVHLLLEFEGMINEQIFFQVLNFYEGTHSFKLSGHDTRNDIGTFIECPYIYS